jgi:hypothetical protein
LTGRASKRRTNSPQAGAYRDSRTVSARNPPADAAPANGSSARSAAASSGDSAVHRLGAPDADDRRRTTDIGDEPPRGGGGTYRSRSQRRSKPASASSRSSFGCPASGANSGNRAATRSATCAGVSPRRGVAARRVASLPAAHAQPADLQERARLEWHIENRLH